MSEPQIRTRRRPVVVTVTATALLAAALSAAGAAPAVSATPASGPASVSKAGPGYPTPASDNVVISWNKTLLGLLQTPGAQPPTVQSSRDFAMMSAAVYDAVAAIDGRPQYGLHLHAQSGASEQSAAAQAAHDMLVPMFPAQTAQLDAQLTQDLAAVHSAKARDRGVAVGKAAAKGIFDLRIGDGATATPPPYQTTGKPGDYLPTPPKFPAPVFTHWSTVKPFVLRAGNQFRPVPPPALTSAAYAKAVGEVQQLGQDTSTVRTPDQTATANFWSGPIQNSWNVIADQASTSKHEDIAESAKTMALLNFSIADATVAFYDAKYTYRVWRPISAIRGADTDGNPATTADPNWSPQSTTPPDPSYPGAHSAVSRAASVILSDRLGYHTQFDLSLPAQPGMTRHFSSFRSAAREAGLSRLYAGVHTRVDHTAGTDLGYQVGWYTLHNALKKTNS